jgi:hypothetical protein
MKTCEDVAQTLARTDLAASHDNAPSHTSFLNQQVMAKHEMAVIRHPSYSPDLAAYDFFLFPKMKLKLKGCRFGTIEEM